jgi:hypothetical protein
MHRLSFLVFSLAFLGFSAFAEYRAFLLEIKSADGQSTRTVKSNLDPLQYPAFYPLKTGETISYTDTWMCEGRTGGKPLCKSPKEVAAEAAGADETSLEPVPERAPAETKN